MRGMRRRLAGQGFSIRTKLIWAMLAVSLLPAFVINGYYYGRINDSLELKVRSYNEELIQQLADKVEIVSEQTRITQAQLVAYAVTSRSFQDYDDKSGLEKLDTLKKTEELLGSLKRSYPIVSEIYMVGTDGTVYATDAYLNRDALLASPWIREAMAPGAPEPSERLLLAHRPDYTLLRDKSVLSFVKTIGAYGKRRDVAVIQIDVDAAKFDALLQLSSSANDESVYLFDRDGRSIFARPSAELAGVDLDPAGWRRLAAETGSFGSAEAGGRKMLVSARTLEQREWTIVVASPMSRFSLDFRQTRSVLFIVAGLTLVAAVASSVLLSQSILRPFHALVKSMRRAGEGRFDTKVPEWNSPDIGMLAARYNKMLDQIDELMKMTRKKEEEKTAAELKALQAQIHPHFLYNTLNSLKWQAITEGSDRIAGSVVALVKVLRFLYRTNETFIPLADELAFIRDYVTLQRMRYGEQAEVSYDWDERIDRCLTLKFILQPLVENAMIHGLAEKSYRGSIVIRGRLEEESARIRLEVEDNGVGMPPAPSARMSGVGMGNVNDRIRMHFGEPYGVSVQPPVELNTRVVIDIPILHGDGEGGPG